MHQTTEAKKFWNLVPKDKRIKILNNVWCGSCKKGSGIGHVSMSIEGGDLILRGVCTVCNSDVARLIEGTRELRPPKIFGGRPDICHSNPNISNLAKFRKGTKAADFIETVGILKIKHSDHWDPADELQYQGHTGEDLQSPFDQILASGKRCAWEMENILPGDDPHAPDCPIGVGIDMMDTGDWYGAVKHMKSLIQQDQRCLDAYAHLGTWYFEYGNPHELNTAKNYYKTGVAIGLKSIGDNANDVFPWGFIDNRPFFRCLHGLGLCFYRQNRPTEAFTIFSKMVWLNPSDNQGARFLINAIIDGVSWGEFQANEDQMRCF